MVIEGQVAQPPAYSQANSGLTAQPDAYEAYLKGRYFWNRRTEAGLNKSIDYFQDAIAKDPTSAAAYAGLASAERGVSRTLGCPSSCWTRFLPVLGNRLLECKDEVGSSSIFEINQDIPAQQNSKVGDLRSQPSRLQFIVAQ